MYNNVNQTDMRWTAREIQNQARIALPAARIMALLLTASRGEGGRRAGPGIDPGPDEQLCCLSSDFRLADPWLAIPQHGVEDGE